MRTNDRTADDIFSRLIISILQTCQWQPVEDLSAEALPTMLRRATHDKKNVVFRSRSASGESEQNDAGRCGCRGIASFCRSGGIACESGQNNCSPWFCSFCRVKAAPMAMGPGCAQRSLSAASLFGYFCGDKSNWPRAAKSATM